MKQYQKTQTLWKQQIFAIAHLIRYQNKLSLNYIQCCTLCGLK